MNFCAWIERLNDSFDFFLIADFDLKAFHVVE